MTAREDGQAAAPGPALTLVLDDYALQAVPGLAEELARSGALVMRSFKGLPGPHLLRRFRGAAVVGGPDRTGLLARLERATSSVAAPVIAILPEGVAPEPALRGPGVVDLIPRGARDVARRVLLMARVPIVGAQPSAAPRSAAGPQGRPTDPQPDAPAGRPAAGGGDGRGASVVAVASSTGGVWVLASMLRDLPTAGRAIVVAQHMEAEFVPSFADWLTVASGWRILVVEGAATLAEGTGYVPAGGCDLVVEGAAVRALPASGRFVPSADRLLRSAAALGRRTTGVVLSGMGSDGAAGLAAIAERGGRALCQSPGSAVVPSMPESALARARGALAVAPGGLAGAIAAGI